MNENDLHTTLTHNYVDLAAQRIGGETLACSDDFFAPMANLIKPGRGIFIDDKYTDRGKWMDGWESRRRFGRTARTDSDSRDRDWCVLRLGVAGIVHGVDVDTHHFRGNAPQSISIEACAYNESLPNQPPFNPNDKRIKWVEILSQREVKPHSQNLFTVNRKQTWTHIRLNIFPDGGVARLRLYGEAQFDRSRFLAHELIDLAAIENGGRALLCSDMFFSDKNNLLMPGRGINMGDGWETKRRRGPGNDWVIIKLAAPGSVNKVIVDTHHFKGNFPDHFSLEGVHSGEDLSIGADTTQWQPVIPETSLYAHREHLFLQQIVADANQIFTHVRFNIFPDGGVSRLRIYGYIRPGHV